MSRRKTRHDERNRRAWGLVLKAGLLLGAVGATGYYSFEAGVQLSQGEIAALENEVATLAATAQSHEERVAGLVQALDAARGEAAEYKARYDEVAPSDDIKALLAQIHTKMKAGLSPKRIGTFIAAADKPRNCEASETKRFVVKTQLHDGNNTWVRFSDVITITAEGNSAVSSSGAPEAWFDPDKPVTIRFSALGGRQEEISGKLPLQHAIVLKNHEHRFMIAPGSRGFLEVAGDRCDVG